MFDTIVDLIGVIWPFLLTIFASIAPLVAAIRVAIKETTDVAYLIGKIVKEAVDVLFRLTTSFREDGTLDTGELKLIKQDVLELKEALNSFNTELQEMLDSWKGIRVSFKLFGKKGK